MVGNFVLRRRVSGALKRNFRPYNRWYISPNENFEYGYPHSNALFNIWAASSEFGTYRLCEQRRFRRACASAQSRQNLRCSLIQAVSQEEPSDRKPDSWPLWMAGHAQLKFVMTECSKTQIRLAGLIYSSKAQHFASNWSFVSNVKQLRQPVTSDVTYDVDAPTVYLRDEFHFSEVNRGVNYIWSRAKFGVHVNFASDPV